VGSDFLVVVSYGSFAIFGRNSANAELAVQTVQRLMSHKASRSKFGRRRKVGSAKRRLRNKVRHGGRIRRTGSAKKKKSVF